MVVHLDVLDYRSQPRTVALDEMTASTLPIFGVVWA